MQLEDYISPLSIAVPFNCSSASWEAWSSHGVDKCQGHAEFHDGKWGILFINYKLFFKRNEQFSDLNSKICDCVGSQSIKKTVAVKSAFGSLHADSWWGKGRLGKYGS